MDQLQADLEALRNEFTSLLRLAAPTAGSFLSSLLNVVEWNLSMKIIIMESSSNFWIHLNWLIKRWIALNSIGRTSKLVRLAFICPAAQRKSNPWQRRQGMITIYSLTTKNSLVKTSRVTTYQVEHCPAEKGKVCPRGTPHHCDEWIRGNSQPCTIRRASSAWNATA